MIAKLKEYITINNQLCYLRIYGQIWDNILLNCYDPIEDNNYDI